MNQKIKTRLGLPLVLVVFFINLLRLMVAIVREKVIFSLILVLTIFLFISPWILITIEKKELSKAKAVALDDKDAKELKTKLSQLAPDSRTINRLVKQANSRSIIIRFNN